LVIKTSSYFDAGSEKQRITETLSQERVQTAYLQMFVSMGGERRKSLYLHDKEFVSAQKTCHDKDRLTSHVSRKNICVGGTDMAYDLG
jgi:glutathione synthase/RimK-type ligase-like ATP-grasp enzyme